MITTFTTEVSGEPEPRHAGEEGLGLGKGVGMFLTVDRLLESARVFDVAV